MTVSTGRKLVGRVAPQCERLAALQCLGAQCGRSRLSQRRDRRLWRVLIRKVRGHLRQALVTQTLDHPGHRGGLPTAITKVLKLLQQIRLGLASDAGVIAIRTGSALVSMATCAGLQPISQIRGEGWAGVDPGRGDGPGRHDRKAPCKHACEQRADQGSMRHEPDGIDVA